jgi:hypothetical protein
MYTLASSSHLIGNTTEQNILAASDDIVAALDLPGLAIYLAQKSPEEGPGAAKWKKETEEHIYGASTGKP